MSASLYVPCIPPYIYLRINMALCLAVYCVCTFALTSGSPLQVPQGEELENASNQEDAKAPTETSLKSLGLPQPDFHSLILDLSTLSFVDTMCIKSLKNVRGCGQARALKPSC